MLHHCSSQHQRRRRRSGGWLAGCGRYKDTRHGQHFRNGSVVALKLKFISISPNHGAQCVQLDQSDCLLWWAFEVWPIRLFALHTLWKFRVTQALLGHASYLFIWAAVPVPLSAPPTPFQKDDTTKSKPVLNSRKKLWRGKCSGPMNFRWVTSLKSPSHK